MFRMDKMQTNGNETVVKQNSECFFQSDYQSFSNKSDGKLGESQEMGQLVAKLTSYSNKDVTDIVYYGVSIPNDVDINDSSDYLNVYTDKEEALKAVKKYKRARFKAFKTKEEAVEFCLHGCDVSVNSPCLVESIDLTSVIVGEKPSPFKGPKSQELVKLRKLIECGDTQNFKMIVWQNPRYLVSSGDTPSILQEGSRYNALHVAAKSRNAAMCELVLQTVSNPEFVQLLYGEQCPDRASILLDLYLNTPDKGLNETPLHFAVKFGAVSVVETLVSYPQCDRNPKNKFGQTPKDIICSRVSSPDAGVKQEIMSMLSDRFYVPVLRSEDNSVQPTVGYPFSPTCPPVLHRDPLRPRMEIRAYAGPMERELAKVFHKKWKTPPRISRTPTKDSNMCTPNSPVCRLQDTEKGLERVGRVLAQEYKVGWKEYWPFLGTFIDIASPEGLQMLENYLKQRFLQTEASPVETEKQSEAEDNGALSPMSDLCLAFGACTLSDKQNLAAKPQKKMPQKLKDNPTINTEDEALHIWLNPGRHPFLYVERSCQVYAKRISDGLVSVGHSLRFGDSIYDMLQLEARHLYDLMGSFMDDARFVSVDFSLVHSRIATIVTLKLKDELNNEEIDFISSALHDILQPSSEYDAASSDEEDLNSSYRYRHTLPPHKEKDTMTRKQVKCISQQLLSALETLDSEKQLIRIQTEEECMEIWSDAVKCLCLKKFTRKGSSFKRRYIPTTKSKSQVEACNLMLEPLSKRLFQKASPEKDNEDDSDDDDSYLTPPSSPESHSRCHSPSSSDDEIMTTPEEGIDVYIEGNTPSKMDLSVMQAIESCGIDPVEFPNIYRWRHLVLLHPEKERVKWSSPWSPKVQTNVNCQSSPTAGWHRIVGPYSPLGSPHHQHLYN